MGTTARVLVSGAGPGLDTHAERRLRELEARWSRFLPNSELMQLNRASGRPVRVSAETFALITRAVDSWRETSGWFDPTGRRALTALGYDRDFAELATDTGPRRRIEPFPGCAGVALDPIVGTVSLPVGVELDLGGIGKGYAADRVTMEMMDLGASGACVDLGGDVRCAGVGPAAGAWEVAFADPRRGRPSDRVRLAAGGVATSTIRLRRWCSGGVEVHHLLDPATGRPTARGVASVTVVAGETWWAEVLAKSVIVAGRDAGQRLLEEHGVSGLIILENGREYTTPDFDRWTITSGADTRSS